MVESISQGVGRELAGVEYSRKELSGKSENELALISSRLSQSVATTVTVRLAENDVVRNGAKMIGGIL